MTPLQNELRKYVSYNPETGILTSVLAFSHFKGKCLGSFSTKGYLDIKIEKRSYRAHRVAWALMTGEWPPEQIDHINGIRHDNRWGNLRLANASENMSNRKINENNSVGYKGVSKRGSRYRAYINKDGKRQWIGNTFTTAEEAYTARCAVIEEIHGEFARAA